MRMLLVVLLILLSLPLIAETAPAQDGEAPSGQKLLESALAAEAGGDPMAALFNASRAVGYSAFVDVSDNEHPPLFEPGSAEYQEAMAVVERNAGYLQWSSAIVAQQQHQAFETVVWDLAWSLDGSRVASRRICSGSISVYDGLSGKLLQQTQDSDGFDATGFAWSPDGESIAVAKGAPCGADDEEDLTFNIEIYNAASGELEQRLAGHPGYSFDVAWSHDGTRLAVSSPLCILDPETNVVLRTWETGMGKPTWSPDDRFLAGISSDGKSVLMVDVEGGEPPSTLYRHGDSVQALAWSPDGTCIASTGFDGAVIIWDMAGAAQLHRLECPGGRFDGDMAWSPDGTRLVIGGCGNEFSLWDAEQGIPLDAWENGMRSIKSLAWSPDGTRIAAGDWSGFLHIWDAESGPEWVLNPNAHGGGVINAAWSEDGSTIASLGSDGTLREWDAADGRLLSTQDSEGLDSRIFEENGYPSRDGREGVRSPDGTRELRADFSSVFLVDVANDRELNRMRWACGGVRNVVWSPDGRLVAFGGVGEWSASATDVYVWDGFNGESRLRLPAMSPSVGNLIWSPDGTHLAVCGRTLTVWDVTGGAEGRYNPDVLRYILSNPYGYYMSMLVPLGGIGEVVSITRH